MDLPGPQIGNIQKIPQPDCIDPGVVEGIPRLRQRGRCAARHRRKFKGERTRRNRGVHAATRSAGDDANRHLVSGRPWVTSVLGRTPVVERLDQEVEGAGGVAPGRYGASEHKRQLVSVLWWLRLVDEPLAYVNRLVRHDYRQSTE